MGVILRSLVEFPEAGLKVGNDLSGFLVDATVSVEMIRGSAGVGFELKLPDLLKGKADALSQRLQDHAATHVSIKLGYSDGGPFEQVLDGVVERVRAVVEEGRLVTIVRGRERASYVLHRARYQRTFPQNTTLSDAMTALVRELQAPTGEQAPTPQVDSAIRGNLPNLTVRGSNAAAALLELSELADAELQIADGKVWVGNPIRYDDYAPAPFDRDRNLASFEPFVDAIPGDNDRNVLRPATAQAAHGFSFVVTGDPKLRPGQRVSAKIDGYLVPTREFRIHSLVHKYSPSEGYLCQGRAVKVSTEPGAARVQRRAQLPTAESIIEGLSRITAETRRERPSLEVGKVKEYSAGTSSTAPNRATLYYGQTYERTETQPSIHTAVDTDEQQVANQRPMLSPFAWHKCGLVVPVYPGMKALLAHNLGLGDDSLVAGFLWSEQPAIQPPRNEAGDWWLCLPSDYDGSAPPSDSTKATNDLTGSNGKRVIELKGLKVVVGGNLLRPVGERPAPGADDEFLIEHKKARIRIGPDGEIEIVADSAAGKGRIHIAPGGDIEMSATGGVTLKVGASGVQIS